MCVCVCVCVWRGGGIADYRAEGVYCENIITFESALQMQGNYQQAFNSSDDSSRNRVLYKNLIKLILCQIIYKVLPDHNKLY